MSDALDPPRAANHANWESRVPIHAVSETYDLAGMAADPTKLSKVVVDDVEPLGDIAGLEAVHLQCHIGTDTVSLARLGARMTGLDFSSSALAVARDLAAACGQDVEFVEAELYDAPSALGGRTFDLVYTGVGALCWLPDVRAWARVMAALLRPGGRLYLREGHPVLWATEQLEPGRLELRYPYFENAEPIRFDWAETYTGGGEVTSPTTYEWNHGLGEIVQAVLDAGLQLTSLVERDVVEWQAYPWFVRHPRGRGWIVPGDRSLVPLSYTLQARRP